ncbi:hypothetical protein hamaS1_13790 [Moorella sp. Hama-1]|nr:hypothetical protein hamaS1_13790 [Moorella sp. Hama-1]
MGADLVDESEYTAGELKDRIQGTVRENIMRSTGIKEVLPHIFPHLGPVEVG